MDAESSEQHDGMVQALAEKLVSDGYACVRADVAGWERPGEVAWGGIGRGHVPDATGLNADFEVFEVATADSIGDPGAWERWAVLNEFSERNAIRLTLVVPRGHSGSARQHLARLKLAGVSVAEVSPAGSRRRQPALV